MTGGILIQGSRESVETKGHPTLAVGGEAADEPFAGSPEWAPAGQDPEKPPIWSPMPHGAA
jgi:hypothetical protein